MGIDISLVQFQAYRLDDKLLMSVSQLYPVLDVEEFTVAPTRAIKRYPEQCDFPIVDWSAPDYRKFAEVVTNPTVIAAWISARQVRKSGFHFEALRNDRDVHGTRRART